MQLNSDQARKQIFGIQPWFARFRMNAPVRETEPAAQLDQQADIAESLPSAVPGESETAASVLSAPAAPVRPSPQAPAINVDMSAMAPVAQAEAETPVLKNYEEPVSFRFVLYISESLILIDNCEEPVDPIMVESKDRLVQNIFRAMNLTLVQRAELLWPMFEHPLAPKGLSDARAYLKSRIKTMGDAELRQRLLFCGSRVSSMFLEESRPAPGDTGSYDGRTALISYSLAQLLNSPKIKSDFYHTTIFPLLHERSDKTEPH